ncbi:MULTISPECIES: DUF2752 domain-containing protein [unclassified Streptomyces]|uniref:DUF2752 domain-containing protein n=1 Tax=unclassified Streptomyces TaxID=2593676 RepID=UPI000CD57815|nr:MULTISPECIES: DUF2752 domain-containing protein [unclassified Streptomyces]
MRAPVVRTLHRTAAPLGVLTLTVAAFGIVGAVDPNEPGHYPACPLLSLAGVLCPGCGGLRSAHAVAHGDLPAALGANALAVAGFALLALVLARWLVDALRDRPWRQLSVRPGHLWAAAAVALVFTVLRNTPPGSFLAP